MRPTVSVIMSTYNEKIEWIEESIQSILAQTYKEFHFVIVLDNPSGLHIKECVEKFALLDNRIEIIENKKNLGLVGSLNKAIEVAQGQYIMRMDADDVSFPDRLQKQLEYMEEKGFDFVFSSMALIDENGHYLYSTNNSEMTTEQIKNLSRFGNVSKHPTWLLKKSLYKDLGGYRDIKHCEDFDFILRCLLRGYNIGKMEIPTISYRVRNTSVSRANGLEQFLNSSSVMSLYKKGLLENKQYLDNLIENNKKKISAKKQENYKKSSWHFNQAITSIKAKHFTRATGHMLASLAVSRYGIIHFGIFMRYRIAAKYMQV